MTVNESIMKEIVRRVLSICRPNKLILFGSAAAGTMSKDSDIDLMLVEDDVTDSRKESIRVRRALRGLGMPIDVIVMNTLNFSDSKDIVGSIAYPADKYGKVLYAGF